MAEPQVADAAFAPPSPVARTQPGPAGTEERHARGRRYLAELEAAFLDAARAAGGALVRDVLIGSSRVRLRFAGPDLVDALFPALAHLATHDEEPPRVELDLWDSASSGVAVPPFPWSPEDIVARGEVRGYGGDVRIVYEPGFGSVTAFDPASRRGVFWVSAAERVPWYERAAPLRSVLHWALGAPGRHLAHAGVIAREGAGVLLAGKGGSGKSTVSLLCLCAGFDYLGDDYVLLSTEGEPTAFSLYATAKVVPEGLVRVPALVGTVHGARGPEEQKLVLDVGSRFPERMRSDAAVTAVVLPRIVPGGPTRLRRTSAAHGLRTLAPSSILQLPYVQTDALASMAALVASVPTYALDLGPDVSNVPELVGGLIASRGRA